jgi:hypothetical protein
VFLDGSDQSRYTWDICRSQAESPKDNVRNCEQISSEYGSSIFKIMTWMSIGMTPRGSWRSIGSVFYPNRLQARPTMNFPKIPTQHSSTEKAQEIRLAAPSGHL